MNLKKIGIYGGTFDPIHIGHLIIAEFFVQQFNLDKCYFVPNKKSPFKTNSELFFTDEERIKMIELSIGDNPNFSLDLFEINNQEISYTINTINYFNQKFPNSELFLLIGWDQAVSFDKWQESQKIKQLSKIVVARRNKQQNEVKQTDNIDTDFILLGNPILDISSTMIRIMITNKKSIRYLVSDRVWNFIKQKKYGR